MSLKIESRVQSQNWNLYLFIYNTFSLTLGKHRVLQVQDPDGLASFRDLTTGSGVMSKELTMQHQILHTEIFRPGKGTSKVLYYFTSSVSGQHMSYIRDAKTPKDAWGNLKKTFTASTTAKKLQLRQELSNIRQNTCRWLITRPISRAKPKAWRQCRQQIWTLQKQGDSRRCRKPTRKALDGMLVLRQERPPRKQMLEIRQIRIRQNRTRKSATGALRQGLRKSRKWIGPDLCYEAQGEFNEGKHLETK